MHREGHFSQRVSEPEIGWRGEEQIGAITSHGFADEAIARLARRFLHAGLGLGPTPAQASGRQPEPLRFGEDERDFPGGLRPETVVDRIDEKWWSAVRRIATSRRRASEPASLRCFQPFHTGMTSDVQTAAPTSTAPTSRYCVATNQIIPSDTRVRYTGATAP